MTTYMIQDLTTVSGDELQVFSKKLKNCCINAPFGTPESFAYMARRQAVLAEINRRYEARKQSRPPDEARGVGPKRSRPGSSGTS